MKTTEIASENMGVVITKTRNIFKRSQNGASEGLLDGVVVEVPDADKIEALVVPDVPVGDIGDIKRGDWLSVVSTFRTSGRPSETIEKGWTVKVFNTAEQLICVDHESLTHRQWLTKREVQTNLALTRHNNRRREEPQQMPHYENLKDPDHGRQRHRCHDGYQVQGMSFEEEMAFAMAESIEQTTCHNQDLLSQAFFPASSPDNVLLKEKWKHIQSIQQVIAENKQKMKTMKGRKQLMHERTASRHNQHLYRQECHQLKDQLHQLVDGQVCFCARLIMSFLDDTNPHVYNHLPSLRPRDCPMCRESGTCEALTFSLVKAFRPDKINRSYEIIQEIDSRNEKIRGLHFTSMNETELIDVLNTELIAYKELKTLTSPEITHVSERQHQYRQARVGM